MPELTVSVAPTRSGVSSSVESSLKTAVSRSSPYPSDVAKGVHLRSGR